jgi:hypothetical protein
VVQLLEEPALTNGVRAVIALALTATLPFVLYFGGGSDDLRQAYQDAVAAVIAFYFGVTGSSVEN